MKHRVASGNGQCPTYENQSLLNTFR